MQFVKELVVVLAIAGMVCWLARPLAALFSTPRDFLIRRNAWCAIAVAAFVCPEFWVFCLVAGLVIVWASRRDSNPSALYLMLLYAVPASFSWRVPMVGISYLVDLDYPLLLSMCLMVPQALRLAKSGQRHLQLTDYCLLAYLALSSVYFVLPEISRGILMTPTATYAMRRACEAFVSIFVPYFVLSRSVRRPSELKDAVAALCLSCGVMATIAIFETSRHWLLYGGVVSQWGGGYNAYLERGSHLRAMASTSHPLVLGYVLAVAFGLWLPLRARVQSMVWRVGVVVLYWLGLLASYSRGPWIGATAIYFVYVAVTGRTASRLFKAAVVAMFVAAIVAVSPLGERIESVIPFLGGTVDEETITYRERLLHRAWEVVQGSPLLGDQYALAKLQDLRSGGIIDLMNGFVNILLDNGFVGLTLFLSFVVLGVYRGWRLSLEAARADSELAALAAALVACLMGTMLMMWAGGLMVAPTAVLIGLISACARVDKAAEGRRARDTLQGGLVPS